MPSPLAVLLATVDSVRHGHLLIHLGVSALRAAAGLAIGATLGVVLAVPALALEPLVILWLGLGEAAKLFIVAVTVVFPVYLNTLHGVRSVDPQLMEMGRVYGLRGAALYREIVLPGALPSILVGLRFALGLSWLVLIIAEHVGATRGLGYVAVNAREFMQMDVLVMTIALWALLGKLADVLARRVERWLLPWQPKMQRLDAV
jgi:sulfonate transport system permease protein